MENLLNKISIVLISYNSSFKLKKFVKKIPNETKILIIDNSKDYSLKKIFKNKKNIKIYFKKNDGYGCSINFAAKKIKTPYFLVVQPDVTGIKKNSLIKFYNYAKKIKDKFSVIGPHFLNASKSGHFQTNLKYKIKEIHNVHGSTMFFNKKIFNKNKGFDKNIFLYWEETDYSKRASKNGYKAYQLNIVKVKHEKGKAVKTNNLKDIEKLENLYTWHFIWSKFYYFDKHYGKFLSLIYFTPILVRILFRICIYKLIKSNKLMKYYCRWDGLKSSILKKKSLMRLDKIPTNL
ncbi:glycosyltransferase [Pelagibacterales bacterium SAG-MED05]|nr:glycosyltransferase [Pelagibacterales bacterium SAG-MED05]